MKYIKEEKKDIKMMIELVRDDLKEYASNVEDIFNNKKILEKSKRLDLILNVYFYKDK